MHPNEHQQLHGFKRYRVYNIQPIQLQSSHEEDLCLQSQHQKIEQTEINSKNYQEIIVNKHFEQQIHDSCKRQPIQTKKLKYKKRSRLKKIIKESQSTENIYFNLDLNLKEINRTFKKIDYDYFHQSITQFMTSHRQVIHCSGELHSGKKSIVLDAISIFRSNLAQICQIDVFEVEIKEKVSTHSISHSFSIHLKKIIFDSSLSSGLELTEEVPKETSNVFTKIKHSRYQFFLIPSFKIQIGNPKRKKILLCFLQKQLTVETNLLIFISSNWRSNKLFNFKGNACSIYSISENLKQHYQQSLVWSVSQLKSQCNKYFNFQIPLANYLTSKIIESVGFDLSLIVNFCVHLQNLPPYEDSCEARKVGKDIVKDFLAGISFSNDQMEMATFEPQQQCIIIAAYVQFKENALIYASASDLYPTYQWVCQSLQFKVKNQREFQKMLERITCYGIIKRTQKKSSNSPRYTLGVDLECIKNQFKNNFLFGRFLRQQSEVT